MCHRNKKKGAKAKPSAIKQEPVEDSDDDQLSAWSKENKNKVVEYDEESPSEHPA